MTRTRLTCELLAQAGAGSMIEKMKFDMGGAGAVLGAARIVAELAPKGVEAHFIIAACENMVTRSRREVRTYFAARPPHV